MRRILLACAAGFIGKALVERREGDGWPIRTAVREPGAAWPEDVEPLVVRDIGAETVLGAALKGVDAVEHLAT